MVGLYILSLFKDVIPNCGLYRDDGLAVSCGTNRQIENMKKKICKVFQDIGLAVTIEANSKIVNFLDVTFDLNTGIFRPFMKDNDTPMYVNCKSNHPPAVLKSIPQGVNKRLNRISANKAVFDSAAPAYQEALSKSGYTHKLEYEAVDLNKNKKKTRKRKITWFNPPFSANVKSNIGRDFLKLIDSAFPPNNPLNKLFSRQSVKVSYKCMPNMSRIVARHNVKILEDNPQQADQQPGCNCQGGPAVCPVQGRCQTDCVVYRVKVTELGAGKLETYTGATGNTFKERMYGHTSDINHRDRKGTCLSRHTWDLKDGGKTFDMQWSIVDRASSFNPVTRKCRVCLKEKKEILYNRSGSTLNKRNEVFNTCRHRTQKLLRNFKT